MVHVNDWYHVVAVFDRQRNRLLLYVNGMKMERMISEGDLFKPCEALPMLGRNPVWQDRWTEGFVALALATPTLPVESDLLDDYVASKADQQLALLNEF